MPPKTKKELYVCQRCRCTVVRKDFDKHKQVCAEETRFPGDSISIRLCHGFVDGRTLYGTEEQIPKDSEWKKLVGWLSNHLILLHPLAMKELGIVSQWPCVLSHVSIDGENTRDLGVVFPSTELSSFLGVARYFKAATDKKLLAVSPVCQIKKLASLTLQLQTAEKLFHRTEEYSCYLTHYLHDAFVFPEKEIQIRFFGQTSFFKIAAFSACLGSVRCTLLEDHSDSFLSESMSNMALNESATPGEKGCIDCRIPECAPVEMCLQVTEDTAVHLQFEKEESSSFIPRIDFSKIGGLDYAKTELKRHILSLSAGGHWSVRTILLFGPTGCGKSLLLSSVATEMKVAVWPVSKSELADILVRKPVPFIQCPTVVAVEDLDLVLGGLKESGRLNDAAAKASTAFSGFLDSLPLWCLCLASARDPDVLDVGLRRRFDIELEVTVPSASERRDILRICLENMACSVIDGEGVTEVADTAHGYTGSDIAAVCKVAANRSALGSGGRPSISVLALKEALASVRPSAMREITLEVPKVQWCDVGGQEELKIQLKQAVEWPLKHWEAFARLGIRPPAGLLLFGPPGCSKTMIARAVATESGLNFLAVKGPELFSKWVGESERAVRELFRRARQVAPAVIFFDEIDALAASRGGGASGVGDRVLIQLLTELDGLESRGRVVVVAATNRPDLIDRALLRPGRLDRVIHVPLPDLNTRQEILNIELTKIPTEAGLNREFLAAKTEGFSGAEIVGLCNEAALCAMRNDINCTRVGWWYFEDALKKFMPRTDKKLLKIYDIFLENCENSDMTTPDI